ncbi:MAG: hypothetical protein HQK87_02830 [Nitrospinae bacterium]|nr:hypothetical protein [Nitrospinota bacterium]
MSEETEIEWEAPSKFLCCVRLLDGAASYMGVAHVLGVALDDTRPTGLKVSLHPPLLLTAGMPVVAQFLDCETARKSHPEIAGHRMPGVVREVSETGDEAVITFAPAP